jgi:hypothetical protein
MIKPNMPNIPGMGAVTDTLDFVKNLWGNMGIPGSAMPGMNIPGMVMPTLSVEEINKRIADLKAVESWLSLNMNMLRTTIQALEVQAATITTLQSMSESFTSTMSGAAQSMMPASGDGSAGAHAGNGATHDGHATERESARPSTSVEPSSKDVADAASLTAPLVNAAAWWNMLQDQFKQAVGSAMANEPADQKAPAKGKPKAKAKSTASASSASSSTARKRSKSAK